MDLEYKQFLFPGGEIGLSLAVENTSYWRETNPHVLRVQMQSAGDVFMLALLQDAVKRQDKLNRPMHLFMPYVPYARQDRMCNPGESFSLKVFADYINHLNFDKVIVVDPHSDVTGAVINKVKIITQYDIINKHQKFIEQVMQGVWFVSPDAGAIKKTAKIAGFFGHSEFIRADKIRNLSDGKILETVVYHTDLKKRDVVILDDICDGGKTFIELAKVLKAKNAGKVILFTTHSIYSKGVDVLFENGIDELWTTNSFKDSYDKRVNVLNIDLDKYEN